MCAFPSRPGSTTRPRVVVVLTSDPEGVARLSVVRPDDQVVVLEQTQPQALREHVRLLPRVDLVVDARADEQRQLRRWRELFYYLRPGGAWVAVRPRRGQGLFAERVQGLDRTGKGLGRRWAAAAQAIRSVEVDDRTVTVVKRGEHLVKLRDAEAPAVLAARAPGLRVEELDSLPGGVLVPHPETSSHGHPGGDDLAAPLPYPPAHLRRYEGRLELIEGSVVKHDDTLLPDTYRWHLQDVPVNKRLLDIDEHVARTRRPEPVHEHLPGSYYYLDYKNPGHYGHLMTEGLSRLWGWQAARQADPDLKLLLRRTEKHDHGRGRPELRLLPALGIDEDDIAWMDHSVSVDRLVGLTPLWHNKEPYSAHPHIRTLWARLRDGLPHADTPTEPAERIFVTRAADGNRVCHNTPEVESFFAGLGFRVVMPGALSIPEQAALFAQARVVAGFGGTGMFNMLFARDLQRVVVLSHTAYDARNEQLMAVVHGAPVHYFWSESDVPQPAGGFSKEAFHSPWSFDLAAHGATLRDLLAR